MNKLNLITNDGNSTKGLSWSFQGKVEYVDQWFLMHSPIPLLLMTSSYLLFVLKIGPKSMKNRTPFNLNTTLACYNALQVLYSTYLLYIGTNIIRANGLVCPSCLMETKESRYLITSSIYAYFLAKVSEMLDTIFFVLRKKYNQVSFLHVYHHFLMIWGPWFALKYEPSYSTIFLGTINSFVHIIMYTYYGLSAFPDLTKYLWWKKYITKLQLVQFVLIAIHAAVNSAYSGCPPSYTLLITIFINVSLFIYLFGSFYVNSYIKSKEALKVKNANLQCDESHEKHNKVK